MFVHIQQYSLSLITPRHCRTHKLKFLKCFHNILWNFWRDICIAIFESSKGYDFIYLSIAVQQKNWIQEEESTDRKGKTYKQKSKFVPQLFFTTLYIITVYLTNKRVAGPISDVTKIVRKESFRIQKCYFSIILCMGRIFWG